MSKGIAEQLAELFGREVPVKSPRRSAKNEMGVNALEHRSHHLDRLHQSLKATAQGNATDNDCIEIIRLAYQAGKVGLRANPKGNEEGLVSRVLDVLIETDGSGPDHLRTVFVVASALIRRPSERKKLRDYLLQETLKGHFDPEGRNGGLTRNECLDFVRRVGEPEYLSELSRSLDQIRRSTAIEASETSKKRAALSAVVREAYDTLTIRASRVSAHPEPLDSEDLALILLWSNVRVAPKDVSFQLLRGALPDRDITRLCSARLAERAAIQYLRNCVGAAEDISIAQLTGLHQDWKTHDIVASNIAYDVKNARRSFSSPSSYSEHCVPEFKNSRRTGQDVVILGVLSDYQTLTELEREEQASCSVLGTTSRAEIVELQGWIGDGYSDVLERPALDGMDFLAGWMFEHPDFQYPGRSQALRKFAGALSTGDAESLLKYKWLLVLAGDNCHALVQMLTGLEKRMYERLLAIRSRIGYSRRSLFMLILAETLAAARANNSEYRPAKWRPWIFAGPSIDRYSELRPLGLQDSEKYIDSLIATLDRIWDLARDRLSSFRRFRLPHPSILQGQDNTGAWTTIIAYCGGWRQRPAVAKCGNSPIHIGPSETCSECARLVCPECGHCKEACSINDQRQAQVAAADGSFLAEEPD